MDITVSRHSVILKRMLELHIPEDEITVKHEFELKIESEPDNHW